METRTTLGMVLDRFKTLQEKHIKALGKGRIDTESLLFERGRAFEDLRNYVSAIPGISIPEACKKQVSDILKKDKMLTDKIKNRQHELSKAITNGQKGKKALKGYQGVSNRSSRVMKITG